MSSQDFGVLLNTAFGAFKDGLHEALAEAGFDDVGGSYGYVFRLLAKEPTSLAEVAQHLGITPQGALKIIDDMVRKGYVVRQPCAEDGRVKLLALTERGTLAIACASRFHKRFEKALAGRIGAANANAARAALEDIVRHHGRAGVGVPRPG
jgi:DNA-binding MarR family transcriptional regulator